ncbi:enoyl-ACP reductase FabI [Flagellimonas sp.]|uniref:enoyl-ACP reductase FabI n=1 Tax=Flagellimonas sp. TaxID=2058762 RepID=UPI003F49CCAF
MVNNSSKWALILGGSSGLGLATAKKLGRNGYNLLILHRDRRSELQTIEKEFNSIRSFGIQLHAFNADALNPAKMQEVVQSISEVLGDNKLGVLVHSIAKGNLKPLKSEGGPTLNTSDFQHTIHAMGISLYDWTKAILNANLFAKDSRIIAFTSEGSTKAWKGYAAVSAAKVTLESLVRSMALEFAPNGLRVNCVQAGITDTTSFQMIPRSNELRQQAKKRNPFGRLTTPEDVANVVYLLTLEEAQWINGTVVKADGGESLR